MVSDHDGTAEPAAPPDQTPEDRARKKKEKIRSAWISFVGRIIAQILGAVATITLGLALADRIRSDAARDGSAATPAVAQQLSTLSLRRHDARPSIAVLPLELFSPEPAKQYLADSLTEELVASLVNKAVLRVASRTSSRQYRNDPRSIPEIAAALRVDVVVEGSLLQNGDTVRIRLRAIDGATDAHLGTVIRDSRIRELPSQRAQIASSAAQELTDIVVAAVRP